jgi:hypothetical protein
MSPVLHTLFFVHPRYPKKERTICNTLETCSISQRRIGWVWIKMLLRGMLTIRGSDQSLTNPVSSFTRVFI